jgi:hypothetical protein
MMKEIKIQIPEGYEGIDEEASNLAEGKIVFKKKEVLPWREYTHLLTGFYVSTYSIITPVDKSSRLFTDDVNRNIFSTKKQAQSMLAMAQLSQIIQNDKRFGGPITDEEWEDDQMEKYVIVRSSDEIRKDWFYKHYHFLAFHTQEQRDLFLKENEDLIRQYFMLD